MKSAISVQQHFAELLLQYILLRYFHVSIEVVKCHMLVTSFIICNLYSPCFYYIPSCFLRTFFAFYIFFSIEFRNVIGQSKDWLRNVIDVLTMTFINIMKRPISIFYCLASMFLQSSYVNSCMFLGLEFGYKRFQHSS